MKCLAIDQLHESIHACCTNIGLVLDYKPEMSREELLECIGNYEGLFVRSKTTIDEELLIKASKLRFVARAGAGVDQLDVAALQTRNIMLFNAPEGNRDAVAEHMMGMLLSLLNHLHTADRDIRQFLWQREKNRGVELKGKTVGLIGLGNMGQAFAQRLHAFGCTIIGYDKYRTIDVPYLQQADLPQLFNQSDVVSLHIPLTDETRNWVDQAFFQSFAKSIYFLNSARGEICDLVSLKDALISGKVRAAALDVLSNERFDRLSLGEQEVLQSLFRMERVLFSPHVAGWSFESYERINEVLCEKISQWKASLSV
jgi:D-3-phosphoglycerate dehydrogenase / 2-oxoglutarate reductase